MAHYISGTISILNFWLRHIPTLAALPQVLRNPDSLSAELAKKPAKLVIEADASIAEKYNREIKELQSSMATHPREREFKHTLVLTMLIRLACVVTALMKEPMWTLAIASTQFLLVPYSAFVSFAMAVALFPPLYIGHTVSYAGLKFLFSLIGIPEINFTFSWWFIGLFFLFDQFTSYLCLEKTPIGPSAPKTNATHIQHFLYGFLNAKTYTVVLLFHLHGFQLNLLVWLVDAVLKLTPRLAVFTSRILMHWALLFYHQHRLAHLPRVYEHAHKFHHYLHDCTAFDAHLYGSGMPEEYFLLFTELFGALYFGIAPTTLNYYVLMNSWANKIGHTRKLDGSGGINHHADHHVLHNKNFSIYNCLLDMYFGTNSDNEKYQYANYSVTRTESKGKIILTLESGGGISSQAILDNYYNPSIVRMIKQSLLG